MTQFYRLVMLCSILCVIGFGAGGLYLLYAQRTALLGFRPIPATVEYSQERYNRRGCQLRLRFSYEVAGQGYVSSQGTPAGRSASCAFADSLPVGLHTTAYYKPATPSEAFLIKEVALVPHVSMMLAVLLGLAGFWLVVDHGAELSGFRATTRRHGEVWQVLPERRTGQRADLTFWAAAIWIPIALLLLADYFGLGGQWNTASGVTVVGVALVSVGFVILAVYYRLLVRTVSEAVVTVSEYPLRRSERFIVRARQRVLAAVEVQELAVRFVCERRKVNRIGRTDSIDTELLHEVRQAGCHNEPASKGQPIEVLFEFVVPEEAEGTTSLDSAETVEWFLEVRTRLKGSPDYVMRHPLVLVSDTSEQDGHRFDRGAGR